MSEIKKYYHRQLFTDGAFGIIINPFYFARRGLFRVLKEISHHINGKILDVGCGGKPYEFLFSASDYIGLELDFGENRINKKADYYYDGNNIPFPDNSFDGVICNQVLEHVFTPDKFLQEINRVLKEGGKIIISVPFVWDEHEQPLDYARYSHYGLRHLLNDNGFEVISNQKTAADISIIFQLMNAYLYKTVFTGSGIINLILTVMIIMPLNVIGLVASKIFPKNPDLYLDNVVLAVKRH
jgi:SAM-dependent methyltransferase